jgi:hypothetical protein
MEEEDYLKMNIRDSYENLSYTKQRTKRLNMQMLKAVVESKKCKTERELEESLSIEIPEDNKGLKILEKMGYKRGQRLGKDCDGLPEPIKFTIKNDKAGVGKKNGHAFETNREKMQKQIDFELKKAEFSIISKTKLQNARNEKDLATARKTCMTLDGRANKTRSAFWPPAPPANLPSIDGYCDFLQQEEIQDLDFENQSAADKLSTIVFYLRSCYNYCLWCSVEYDDAQDLCINCPGETKNEHEEID